ncbi:MAG: ATP-binding protein [Chloroflexi bacterium]|nr:ATP-binding protein [Chloroflexota bacterium]
MEHIAREAMKQGGLLLIDPHGDLCEHVLNVVPASRADDVVLLDLADKNASVGINALDVTLGRGRDKAISDLLKTFAHIWVEAWGPRMENAFEMALRTLFEANKVLVAQDPQQGPLQQYTILDVLPVLTNENFCHALLQQIQDDYLHRWWREYYEPLTLMQQRDVINPVLTKVAKFESILARRIIGQSVSTLNFSQLIAERKIILIKLAKGLIGADVAALVGATILGLLQITLEEQGSLEEKARARLPIILDEFQVLAGVDYGALAELRKYGATFFLATQSLEYLQKLDPLLLPIVLANVRQLIIFHMSAQDSDTLYSELGVEMEDILNLDMHTCYVKLPSANRRQPSFSMKVVPLSAEDPIQAESIRTRSRVRYTCSVDVVDEMLREAMIRSIRLAPATQGKVNRYAGKGPRNAPPAPNGSPPVSVFPPSAGQASPADTADADAPEVRKRRNRGHRGRGRKNKVEAAGGMTPAAFAEDFADEEDFEGELEMIEIQALSKGNSKDGDQ